MFDKKNIILPLDKTGLSGTNRVVNEPHSLPVTGNVIKLDYTAYFTNSIIVVSINENGVETTLEKDRDYYCTEHFSKISKGIGSEICGAILINKSISDRQFKITYAALGGADFYNINNLMNEGLINTNVISFNDIIDKPPGYMPEHHLHDIADIYGLEYLTNELDYVAYTMRHTPRIADYNIANRITTSFANHKLYNTDMIIDDTHIDNMLNVHKITKLQLGLNDVVNYAMLVGYDVDSYDVDYENTATTKYVSNYSLNRFVSEYTTKKNNQLLGDGSYADNIYKNLGNLNTRLDSANSSATANAGNIQSLNSNASDTVNKYNSLYSFLKNYKHIQWNYVMANVTKAVMLDQNSKGTLIDVPALFENLDLWLDFSDYSKMNIDSIDNVSINSITDKSSNYRVFSQLASSKRPKLVANNDTKDIKLKHSALFTNGNTLKLNNSIDLLLQNEYTIITVLTKFSSEAQLFSDTNNVIKYNTINGWVNINTDNCQLISNSNAPDNQALFCISSISSINPAESWVSVNNIINNGLGINSINTNVMPSVLTTIGSNTQSDQLFELSELLIYNRQLSSNELSAIIMYLSLKWVGSTSMSVDLSFLQSNI